MKKFLFVVAATLLGLCFFPASHGHAGTNVFEVENDASNFSAKVKVIRQNHGETEIAFDSDKYQGFYTLPENDKKGEYEQMLEKSKKAKGPEVSVSVDSNRQITSVILKEKTKDKEE